MTTQNVLSTDLSHDSSSSDDQDSWTTVAKPKKMFKKKNKGPASASYQQAKSYMSLDDNSVTFRKKGTKEKKESVRKSKRGDVSESRRRAKIENETENFTLKKVDPELITKMKEYRRINHLTQQQLAQKINEKIDVISSYESGKAIPDGQVSGKLHQLLQ